VCQRQARKWEGSQSNASRRSSVGCGLGLHLDSAPIGPNAGLPAIQRQRLPKVYRRGDHGDLTAHVSWGTLLERRPSPAVPREESERVLRDRGVRCSFRTQGVTGGGAGVADASSRILARNQRISSRSRRASTYFCRRTPADCGVDVYRNSTGGLVLRKSAAKDSRRGDRHDDGVAHIVLRHRVEHRRTLDSPRSH